MARKSIARPRTPVRAKHPSITTAIHLHLPQSWRIVTARKLRATESNLDRSSPRREVPEIRLSGAWLERIGFPKGRRYLISADREIETIYLQAEPAKMARRRH